MMVPTARISDELKFLVFVLDTLHRRSDFIQFQPICVLTVDMNTGPESFQLPDSQVLR